ncbi:hypothetical protein Pint_16442 [Pistacia integerrima]|uniref:Uncharacterized protein n=1 Tax=Pistacia integerrima TaxID=434235 RepID=A0ACC0ZDQ6_9ROSI|nr:hypothetical protein Pint_16442 [Pistacia integerrima]
MDEEFDLEIPKIDNPNSSSEAVDWSSGLFDCWRSPCNALVTACCPCVTFGRVAEILDEGHNSCCTSAIVYMGLFIFITQWAPCKLTSIYRKKLRKKFNIYEAPTLDWVTHLLCQPCAFCQEYRELQSRNMDPSLGWKRIKAMKKNNNQEPEIGAPDNQRMNRA